MLAYHIAQHCRGTQVPGSPEKIYGLKLARRLALTSLWLWRWRQFTMRITCPRDDLFARPSGKYGRRSAFSDGPGAKWAPRNSYSAIQKKYARAGIRNGLAGF